MSRTHRPAIATMGLLLTACAGSRPVIEEPAQTVSAITPTPATTPAASPYPPVARRPVRTEYHGTAVIDDYQWLENPADPEVKSWVVAENKLSRSWLDAVPGRKALHARIEQILSATSADRFWLEQAGGHLFAIKEQPPKQQPFLVVLDSAGDPASERVVVDPNLIDPEGKTAIDYYTPSADGTKVAISLSVGGTEDGTLRVYDTTTGQATSDVVPYANSGTAGGAAAWAVDGSGFYYTRHPHPGERPASDMGFFQQVYFHKLGTPSSDDSYVIGREFPRIAEIELRVSEGSGHLLASVQNGDGGEYWHYLREAKTGKWTELAKPSDKIALAKFGRDGNLYLLSLSDAPRGKVLRLDAKTPNLSRAVLLVPQTEVTIQSFHAAKTKLYVRDLVGGPSAVRVFDLKGKARGTIEVPPISTVRELVGLRGDDLMFRGESYTSMPCWYHYSASTGRMEKTKLEMTAPVAFDDLEVSRELVASADGTRVPLNIIRKRGTVLDGSNPTILTGYGGYGVSLQPAAKPLMRVWFDRGGVFAVANLRGGGELGEAWHLAGNLTHKQNVFDDFYACAKHLVESKYTNPSKLGIMGGSNGGLLMGAALTQHPDMFKAVASRVGIYDILRVELSPNGAFNVTEFGTVKNPEHFKAMFAYSPLHHVTDGVAYPAALFTTGDNDPRVDPMHSRKMVARLQAATSGGLVLLRADAGQGHGGGTPLSEEIDQATDLFAFFMTHLNAL